VICIVLTGRLREPLLKTVHNALSPRRFVPGAGVGVEEHTVVLQSHESLPAVTKIFTDNLNYLQVWALNAVPNAENRHTVKINTLHKQSVTARA
jgi:hypothetical protein